MKNQGNKPIRNTEKVVPICIIGDWRWESTTVILMRLPIIIWWICLKIVDINFIKRLFCRHKVSPFKDDNPIVHPISSIDKGYSKVDCKTDLFSLEPVQVARLILNVNEHATNFFIQHIRRKLSVLERPLTTARGDGKSYIYSNFNPKYAQMATTILRTYYNFCLPYKFMISKN